MFKLASVIYAFAGDFCDKYYKGHRQCRYYLSAYGCTCASTKRVCRHWALKNDRFKFYGKGNIYEAEEFLEELGNELDLYFGVPEEAEVIKIKVQKNLDYEKYAFFLKETLIILEKQ